MNTFKLKKFKKTAIAIFVEDILDLKNPVFILHAPHFLSLLSMSITQF
tara:strand:+ start:105 stop:248 length:144 start_codon:yes stop_codon:yes gene_type:complete